MILQNYLALLYDWIYQRGVTHKLHSHAFSTSTFPRLCLKNTKISQILKYDNVGHYLNYFKVFIEMNKSKVTVFKAYFVRIGAPLLLFWRV